MCSVTLYITDSATTEIYAGTYTLSLRDALPIWVKELFEEDAKVSAVDITLKEGLVLLDSDLSNEEIAYILGEDYPIVSIDSVI